MMTTDEVKTTVKHHRRSALVGGVIGLAALCAWFGYDIMMTPSRPDLNTASAEEVVLFIASERGLGTMAHVEQQRFLDQWMDVCAGEERRKDVREYFRKIDDETRARFSEPIFRHIKRVFLDQAEQFAMIESPTEKSTYIRERIADFQTLAMFIKDVAVGFDKRFSGGQADIQRYIMEHTTPEEQAIGEPYFNALTRIREQLKKEQRGTQTAEAHQPTA